MANITIKLKPIDTAARGSYRKQAAFKRAVAHMVSPSNPDGHDDLIRFILDNAEVKAPDGVDVFEELLDYSADEIQEMARQIMGLDSVPPQNGANSATG